MKDVNKQSVYEKSLAPIALVLEW